MIFRDEVSALLLLLVATSLVIFFPNRCFSDSRQVFFSEIMWAGSSVSTADEWVELYNDSDEVIDLSGWSVFDNVKNEKMLTIPDGQIAPKGHFVISNNTKDHQFSKGESILNIDPDIVDSSVSLNNSNLKISLISNDGEVSDSVGDGKRPFFGNSSVASSMERTDYILPGEDRAAWKECTDKSNLDEDVSDIANPDSSGRPKIKSFNLDKSAFESGENIILKTNYLVEDSGGDLEKVIVRIINGEEVMEERQYGFGQFVFELGKFGFCPKINFIFVDKTGLWVSESVTLSCYLSSEKIKFYETLPHPKQKDWNKDGELNSDDEWIELVNFGKSEVDLSGWKICDEKDDCFAVDGSTIMPENFLVFYKSSTGISINDSGDKLFLFDPAERLVDSIKVPASSSKYDQSYAKWGGKWYYTVSPTPNEVNLITQTGSKHDPDYKYIQEAEGKTIEIDGEVIESDRSSMTILVNSKPVMVVGDINMSDISSGDRVSLTGIAKSGLMPRIVATSIPIKINSQAAVSLPQGNDKAMAETSSSLVITKTTKTKKIKYLKIDSTQIKPMVLGSSNVASKYFNFLPLLLYFSGALGFMMVVKIYDFCCRK